MSILIITSTVNVNSFLTVLVDPKIRLEQYVDSIAFYLNAKVIDKIVVCDNSEFDYSELKHLSELACANNKEIEFLNFKGSVNQIQAKGKGFGEGEIMNYVLTHSKLFLKEEGSFFKVTGRLKVVNIDWVVKYLNPNVNYFNPVNLNPFVNLKKVDTRFYQCNKENFKYYFADCYASVNDSGGVFLEHVYYNKLIERKINFKSFGILPLFYGISGSTGLLYKMSNFNFLIRQFLFTVFKVLK